MQDQQLEPYNPARPPRMTDLTQFPAETSLAKVLGTSVVNNLDAVVDPDYNWQQYNPVTSEGKKRVKKIKEDKAAAVEHYVIELSHFWSQYRPPFMTPNKMKVVDTYTVGYKRDDSTTVEAAIEMSLGVQKGIFSGEIKGSLKWTTQTSVSFEQVHTETREEDFDPGHWYIYWQTLEAVTLYRKKKGASALTPISRCLGRSLLLFTDKVKIPDFATTNILYYPRSASDGTP